MPRASRPALVKPWSLYHPLYGRPSCTTRLNTPWNTLLVLHHRILYHLFSRHLTEKRSLLNTIGGIVLAERGFGIKDSAKIMCSEINVPAFIQGHCSLYAKDMENTWAYMGVKKVIGSMCIKWTMLHKRNHYFTVMHSVITYPSVVV